MSVGGGDGGDGALRLTLLPLRVEAARIRAGDGWPEGPLIRHNGCSERRTCPDAAPPKRLGRDGKKKV